MLIAWEIDGGSLVQEMPCGLSDALAAKTQKDSPLHTKVMMGTLVMMGTPVLCPARTLV